MKSITWCSVTQADAESARSEMLLNPRPQHQARDQPHHDHSKHSEHFFSASYTLPERNDGASLASVEHPSVRAILLLAKLYDRRSLAAFVIRWFSD